MPKSVPKLSSIHQADQQVVCILLRELRLAAGLRQDEVAARLHTSQTTVSEMERGQRGVDLLVFRRLVALYGADWVEVIAELDRRLKAAPTPASHFVRAKSAPEG